MSLENKILENIASMAMHKIYVTDITLEFEDFEVLKKELNDKLPGFYRNDETIKLTTDRGYVYITQQGRYYTNNMNLEIGGTYAAAE